MIGLESMFDGKKILITGGTGSLGQALTKRLLKFNVDTIRIYSRNETNQISMNDNFDDPKLRFLIGDIRDLSRLDRAMEDIDIVFHTAALKHVPLIEYNPFEAIKTNVIGSQNVIDASLNANVDICIGVGTDKSVSPLNTYGATKLLTEKLFVTAQNYLNPKKHKTKFAALRYGNVLGSSGSVVPKFIEQIQKNKKITITDPNMTRFSITMDEALDFILNSVAQTKGSEVFIPKIRAYSVEDLKNALKELLDVKDEKIIGIREGEKMHEILINEDEVKYSWELNKNYLIFNGTPTETTLSKYDGIKSPTNLHEYSSERAEKISKDELKQVLIKSELIKEL
jgi:UDP-N-acetylglucosamine 4,6-dehydratase/5-epimerase